MAGEDKISSNSKSINTLRILVKTYIDRQQYETALFWADKVVSLSKGEVHDVYWLSHIQFLLGQFHRAAKTIKNNQLHKKYLAGRYLAAKCHFQCGEHTEALDILDDSENNMISAKPQSSLKSEVHPDIPHEKMESCVHLLRGRVYEALENRNLASECFREALVADVFCYEAFDCLVKHNMLTAQQEKDLLESLPLDKQCTEDEKELVKFLYESKLKKYNRPDELSVPSSLQVLRSNVDVRLNLAERHFYNCDFRECHNITTSILSSDPLNENCLILQVSVLVELKKPNGTILSVDIKPFSASHFGLCRITFF